MKQFFLFVLLTSAAVLWFQDQVESGRFLQYLDAHPDRKGTATVLFWTARYYEIFNSPEKAIPAYRRVAKRYPASRYGADAQYGLAAGYEMVKDWENARTEFEDYLERYPRGRYSDSVRNNLEFLKSR